MFMSQQTIMQPKEPNWMANSRPIPFPAPVIWLKHTGNQETLGFPFRRWKRRNLYLLFAFQDSTVEYLDIAEASNLCFRNESYSTVFALLYGNVDSTVYGCYLNLVENEFTLSYRMNLNMVRMVSGRKYDSNSDSVMSLYLFCSLCIYRCYYIPALFPLINSSNERVWYAWWLSLW